MLVPSIVSTDYPMIRQNSCSLDTLANLASLVDDDQRALTFYFDSTSASSCSHQDEDVRLQSLISRARSTIAGTEPRKDIEEELDFVRALESEIGRHPQMFHALFASQSNSSLYHIALPLAAEISILHFDRHFELVPLVRALEACKPYAVFLVENGKARSFHVRGDHIEECEALSLEADISPHAHRERTGWPHRIDANAEERSDRFFRQIAETARGYLRDIGAKHLIVGCRNDVWHKIQAELAYLGLTQAGRFALTAFEMTPAEVLQNARAAHVQLQDQQYQDFWDVLSEDPRHSATEIEDILNCLEEGRVRKLFLGALPDFRTMECADCGNWNPPSTVTCINCKSSAVHVTPVAELLLRRALSTHSEIIAPSLKQLNGRATGALLRY